MLVQITGYRIFYRPGQGGAIKIQIAGDPAWRDLGPYPADQMAALSAILNGTGHIAFDTVSGEVIAGRNLPPNPPGGIHDVVGSGDSNPV
jgi:hypothetical protein